MTEDVRAVLHALLDSTEGAYTPDLIAHEMDVSRVTIHRWLSGTSKPRADYERRLRRLLLAARQRADPAMPESTAFISQQPLMMAEGGAGERFHALLRELREILHRRGRLSSRNEALDELSKLLFAHVVSLASGGSGITTALLAGDEYSGEAIALRLKDFVRRTFERHLPTALAHELDHNDYELHLKPQETLLATEIVDCFARLAPSQGAMAIGGLADVDLLNDAFGSFLADSFVNEKELGQYLTPTEVVRFMVELALQDMSLQELTLLHDVHRCDEFGLILDPSCGTASFLTEFLRRTHAHVVQTTNPRSGAEWLSAMANKVIVGMDKSERMVKLALTSMAMFGAPAAKLHLVNSLARSGSDATITDALHGQARLIITNPPFGAEFVSRDLDAYHIAHDWTRRHPATVDSELLFIERYLDWLMPGGQCLVVVPDSILTNRGLFEDLRTHVASQIDLRSIVSLPPVTFGAAGTSTKTSILHFRKRSERSVDVKSGATYFAICSNVGYSVATRESQRIKVTSDAGELPRILEEYRAPENGLTFGRRVRGATSALRWDATYHASLPRAVEQRLAHPQRSDLTIADVAILSNERADPRRWGAEVFEYIEISDIDTRTATVYSNPVACAEAPSRARKLVHAGDILVSTVRPERRAVGVVSKDLDGAVCTTGFAVLRPRCIDPLTLAYLLKTDFVNAQLMRRNIGIAYPAIDEQSLLDVILPLRREQLEEFQTRAGGLRSSEEALRTLRAQFRAVLAIAVEQDTASALSQESQAATTTTTPHQPSQTTPRRRRRKVDSGSHGQGARELLEDRMA